MKKSILLLVGLALSASLYAQSQGRVGINTLEPKATLDISKEGVDDAKGLLVPRLTADEVKTMTDANKVGEDQNSLLLYVTEPFEYTTNQTGKYEQIDQAGYYYYDAKDNGGKWKKLDTTLYGSNGTLSANRTVTMDGKTLTFSGTNVQIKVPNMQERPATENVSGVVMSADGTLKKDTGWWRLGDGEIDLSKINNKSKFFLSNGGMLSINKVKAEAEKYEIKYTGAIIVKETATDNYWKSLFGDLRVVDVEFHLDDIHDCTRSVCIFNYKVYGGSNGDSGSDLDRKGMNIYTLSNYVKNTSQGGEFLPGSGFLGPLEWTQFTQDKEYREDMDELTEEMFSDIHGTPFVITAIKY
ncbi:hypothetical protein ACQ1Q5_08505 [Ornithobacterium rhinotracheale]